MSKTTFHISGMHCKSCEVLLEKELNEISGIEKCEVSHSRGVAEIEFMDNVPRQKIERAITSCGYRLVSEAEKNKLEKKSKNTFQDYLQIVLVTLGMGAAAFLLGKIEITKLFPDFGSQINILIALVFGVVASLSTCLVLVGGIVLSFGEMYPIHEDTKHPFLSRALPHVYFHIGRVGGFVLLGGVLGLLGSKINYSLSFTGYLTIVIAVVMLYIGLQILGVVPNITKLGFHLPKKLSSKIHKLQGSNHHLAPILIGALTFFLPCGFTQTMQLAAVASGDFFAGALIMGAFALGTLPALLAVGIGSTYAKKREFNFVNKIIGVVVVFFAIYSLNSGLVLAGSSFTIDFWNSSRSAVVAAVSEDIQVVKMDVDWVFQPTEFKIKKGVPVRWEINGINVSGCSNEVVIPQLNIRQKIYEGRNIVEFTPTKEGVLPFSCWMGMLNGRFIVTDNEGGFGEITQEDIERELAQPIQQGSCNGSCGSVTCGARVISGSCGCGG